MKVLRILIIIIVLTGFAYGGYYAYAKLWPKKKVTANIPTTRVEEGEFFIKITEIGKVKAAKSVQVSAPYAGKIVKLCQEGIIVKKGDFLAQMDTTELLRKERDEKIDCEQAAADVKKAEEELRILKISAELDLKEKQAQLDYEKSMLVEARSQLKRQERLFKEMIVTRQNVEDAANKVRSGELAVKKGEIAVLVSKKKNLSDEKKKMAEINIYKLRLQKKTLDYNAAAEDLKNATVTAPASGIVVFLDTWRAGSISKISEGDDVHRGQEIIEIPDLSSLQVIVPVRETDIHRVKIGEETQIKLEANPELTFYGKVVKIDRIAKEPRPWENPTAPGQKTFDVTIDLQETKSAIIRPGMTANVDIIQKKIPKALFLPLESVFLTESKKFVYVKKGEAFMRKEVEVGDRNENFVVILEGLNRFEEVALRDPTKSIEEIEATRKEEKKETNKSPIEMVPGK